MNLTNVVVVPLIGQWARMRLHCEVCGQRGQYVYRVGTTKRVSCPCGTFKTLGWEVQTKPFRAFGVN